MNGRHTQSLSFSGNREIVIETPEGLVVIRRGDGKKDGTTVRHLTIELPPMMRAEIGIDRAVESARFIDLKDGKVVPRFKTLGPMLDDAGNLVGVIEPKSWRVGVA